MKFSVLMSLYYKEQPDYLNQCFHSIWDAQTVRPAEIVLVLDGAIGTELGATIQQWQTHINSVLKVISLPENVGLGQALNAGLAHCTHNWVFRMDTDDVCKPDRFEKQIEYLEHHPDTVLLGTQVLEFQHSITDANTLKSVPISNVEIQKYAKTRNPFNHMTVAYNRDALLALGAYRHHLFMEDYNLWLRMIAAGYPAHNLPEALLYARIGNGMHARRRGWQYIKSEKLLMSLKKQLGIQHTCSAYAVFLVRVVTRFLPSKLLGTIYRLFLRQNIANKSA